MNVEIWMEAAQFPEKEYINGIYVAVYLQSINSDKHLPQSPSTCHFFRGRHFALSSVSLIQDSCLHCAVRIRNAAFNKGIRKCPYPQCTFFAMLGNIRIPRIYSQSRENWLPSTIQL
jgi:hypothetical protein